MCFEKNYFKKMTIILLKKAFENAIFKIIQAIFKQY